MKPLIPDVVYVKTPDGVIIRFAERAALEKWLAAGRIPVELASGQDNGPRALWLDTDNTWKPLPELLLKLGLSPSGAAVPPTPEPFPGVSDEYFRNSFGPAGSRGPITGQFGAVTEVPPEARPSETAVTPQTVAPAPVPDDQRRTGTTAPMAAFNVVRDPTASSESGDVVADEPQVTERLRQDEIPAAGASADVADGDVAGADDDDDVEAVPAGIMFETTPASVSPVLSVRRRKRPPEPQPEPVEPVMIKRGHGAAGVLVVVFGVVVVLAISAFVTRDYWYPGLADLIGAANGPARSVPAAVTPAADTQEAATRESSASQDKPAGEPVVPAPAEVPAVAPAVVPAVVPAVAAMPEPAPAPAPVPPAPVPPAPVPPATPAPAPMPAPKAQAVAPAVTAPAPVPAPVRPPVAAPAPAPKAPAAAPRIPAPPAAAAPAPAPAPKAPAARTPEKAPVEEPPVDEPVAANDYDGHMKAGQKTLSRDPAAALAHFEMAHQMKPGKIDPFKWMGDACLALKRYEAARQHYQDALSINPNYGPAMIGLARVAKARGSADEARRLYQSYLDVNPNGTQAAEARQYLENR